MRAGESGYILPEEIEALRAISEEINFTTRFNFLRSHNGFRRGSIHTVMGVAHGGKSTLVRTMLLDVLLNNKSNAGYWASEESVEDFQTEFSNIPIKKNVSERLFIISEINLDQTDKELLILVERFVIENDLSYLVIDNITTSQFYMDKSNDTQSALIKFFKNMATRLNIAIVLIAHTGAKITENYSGLIEMNDVRGNKSITNLSQFFYIMQSFYMGSARINTLRITKHRGYIVDETIFNLQYSKEHRAFVSDSAINFKRFKEIYKERNRL